MPAEERGNGMKERIRKNRIWLVVSAVVLFCLALCSEDLLRGKAAEDVPLYIYVDYFGGPGLVGAKIPRDKIRVHAAYADGTNVEVTDYQLSVDVIPKEGTNQIAVAFQGRQASFFVMGRTVSALSAYYTGAEISVGNAVSKKNVYAYVTYNDGSFDIITEFEIENPVIQQVGESVITLSYGGKTTEIVVNGRTPGKLSALQATYDGGEVMLGTKINRDNIYVSALYEDGTSESIESYELSVESPTMIGANTVIVTYGNATAKFMVTGYERGIEKLYARYIGDGVEVGKEVRKNDIEVIATYMDGTVEQVEDFDLPTPVIYFEGAHMKTVHYMGLTAEIYVIGIEEKPVSYANAFNFSISNGIVDAECSLALPSGLNPELFSGESLRKASVSQVVPRAIRKSDFIVFEFSAEPEGDGELPLEMKIIPPDDSDPEDCVLYYTPNRKTMIGRMNSYVNDDGEIVVTIYKTGTFLLTYEPDEEEEAEEIEEETEEE